jgi:hypothetical protein
MDASQVLPYHRVVLIRSALNSTQGVIPNKLGDVKCHAAGSLVHVIARIVMVFRMQLMRNDQLCTHFESMLAAPTIITSWRTAIRKELVRHVILHRIGLAPIVVLPCFIVMTNPISVVLTPKKGIWHDINLSLLLATPC